VYHPAVQTGLDRLPQLPEVVSRLKRRRVGLLAHPASVSRELRHVTDVLADLDVWPRVLFGPEHGFMGHAQDMIGVDGSAREGGPRIVSLYGARFDDLTPKPAELDDLDLVLVDLQDVGARYYTFVWTAVLVARACFRAGVEVVVLDRPNPLGRETIEGRLPDAGFLSFVGLEPLPIRHALTLGEIVAFRAKVEGYADAVTIVETTALDAAAHAPEWARPFVMPSPNMPTYDTALVYPGGCLVEGTNLSEGRGTTRPFEIVGAPWLDGRRLAASLSELELPGFVARPLSFEPTFHKHAGSLCEGVQIHVTRPREFRPVATYAALLALAHHAHPEEFRFRTEPYEFVSTIPAIDLLTGSDRTRTAILAGESPREIAEALSRTGPEEAALIRAARSAVERRFQG
jgi:uncharacterized protein YbbC (DUF1343 family)